MTMPLAEIPYHNIDPVIFKIFGIAVHWYGVAYVLGFLVGWHLLWRLAKEGRLPLKPQEAGDVMTVALLGIVVGGRLGYMLFYSLERYLEDPIRILQVWKGGMSFHGGVLGCALALWLYGRRKGVGLATLGDACVVSATPGILLVRCANFINGELYGRETDVPWAIRFPEGGDVLRHPSQLYEGILEGLFLFAILWSLRNHRWLRPPGRMMGAFLVGYALMRFIVEFFREPDAHLGYQLGGLTRGQLLCIAMAVIGAVVWVWAGRRRAVPNP